MTFPTSNQKNIRSLLLLLMGLGIAKLKGRLKMVKQMLDLKKMKILEIKLKMGP